MRFVYACLFVMALVALSISCGKDGKDKDDTNKPPGPDTLTIGWQKIAMPDSIDLYDVFFVNNQVGYLCGPDYLAKSTDGGLNWNRLNLGIPGNNILSNLYFVDANTGWVCSRAGVFATRDGGNTWEKLSENFSDVQFVNATVGWGVSDLGLFKTLDAGKKWTKVLDGQYSGLYFFDANAGWAGNDNGDIKYTADGGQQFLKSKPTGAGRLYYIQFADQQYGWVAGENGIKRTTDAGDTWIKVLDTKNLGDIHFIDRDNGFIMATNRVYRTRNGGATLEDFMATGKGILIEIHFTDINHGWAVGGKGLLYKYSR